MARAYLVLSDGSVYAGEAFGASGSVAGDIAFTTDVAGYMRAVSNPEYSGKILLQTFPLLGNYGAISYEMQGDVCVKGYVVREWCDGPSNFRSEGDMNDFFARHGVVGICGVDTRAIMRRLRRGQLRARICDTLPAHLSEQQTGGEPNAAE